MNTMKRTYTLKNRAEGQAQTRQKIIDATVELHQMKGLSATSVDDIAKRAKVGKVTVYRHFPDETALVNACSGHYFQLNPLPQPEEWCHIMDARERLEVGLAKTYLYHRATEPMIKRVLAEAREHPVMQPYHAHWRLVAESLACVMPVELRDKKTLMATLALALSFDTWNLLIKEQKLSDAKAIDLMVALVMSEQ